VTSMATGLDARATDAVAQAIATLAGRRIAVLTGAGVSTDSGIPDYRGAGAPVRTPMTADQFLASDASRRRYWVGSHLGWKAFAAAEPNPGHRAIADLEARGLATGVVTQNVDGLHRKAGSTHVVELHGGSDRVACLACGQVFARQSIADRLELLNPHLDLSKPARINPDGDAEVDDVESMVLPDCTVCGGVLKPEVVFFGEFVPTPVYRQAASLVQRADVLLIAGSSLVVNSGIRLLEIARRRRIPIVVVNRGVTKGDARATVKIDAGASETLTAMAEALGA
jgi:NAD-dependent SIR2 family protein deacetylase